MDKIAERTNVITESENKSFVHAVINAVTKGYSDNTVLEDIMDLVRRKEVSKGVILAAPDALKSYGESLANSLSFLAEQIKDLEIVDEPIVKKKVKDEEPNVVEQEMDKTEEATEKKASLQHFANVEISEDWSKYFYDKKTNMMTGTLKIQFHQDMSSFKTANKIKIEQNDVDEILNKIYSYFGTEFKKLKATLTPEIFKTPVQFDSVEQGEAIVDYEIKGAF
ncbi:MAG: hypothetical protein PHF86_07760 [Candidatus Nanoarchaeia archaeon]|jgi:hypothetical protein|nr:hypothetical protein [Candidatus Nanoarchaeia archaeon]